MTSGALQKTRKWHSLIHVIGYSGTPLLKRPQDRLKLIHVF
jgi:hypothetical protein